MAHENSFVLEQRSHLQELIVTYLYVVPPEVDLQWLQIDQLSHYQQDLPNANYHVEGHQSLGPCHEHGQ